MTQVHHWVRSTFANVGNTFISASAATQLAQIPFTSHPTGTLLRVVLDVQFIVAVGSTPSPPPEVWIQTTRPVVSIQCDTAGGTITAVNPGTSSHQLLKVAQLHQQFHTSPTASTEYVVRYTAEPQMDTDVKRKGTGSGSNVPTVTAYLWTNDTNGWLESLSYPSKDISWMGWMATLWGDTT